MEITEVKIKSVGNRSDRLKAFCSITFDDAFVVRDLKIIDGPEGLFVAMPSRKLTEHCPSCHAKNSIRARYCDQCGKHLPESMKNGHDKTHADIAHPINAATRSYIQQTVITAYERGNHDSAAHDASADRGDTVQGASEASSEASSEVSSDVSSEVSSAASASSPAADAASEESQGSSDRPAFGEGIV